MGQETRYSAYLVRWQEGAQPNRWRALVEDAYTGERIHFSNKDQLLQFLRQSLNVESSDQVTKPPRFLPKNMPQTEAKTSEV
ncbi:MAG: hypothetical protein AAF614_32160 [Chloroflexota bacterium]